MGQERSLVELLGCFITVLQPAFVAAEALSRCGKYACIILPESQLAVDDSQLIDPFLL